MIKLVESTDVIKDVQGLGVHAYLRNFFMGGARLNFKIILSYKKRCYQKLIQLLIRANMKRLINFDA